MKNFYKTNILIILLFVSACKKEKHSEKLSFKLQVPSANKIYHSAYPDFDDTEDQVAADSITHFENLAGKPVTWVYFSNNWLSTQGGIHFPQQEVEIIRQAGKVPFIRMMARSQFQEGIADPVYTLDKFISGYYDQDIRNWARQAKATKIPLLAEFGTEMNGFWFPWNGQWNGAGNKTGYGDPDKFDGPEKFRDTYRRIIRICREEGAENITWFFHVNVENDPDTDWNQMKNYYPGDDYIDWIGMSVYGSLGPDEPLISFRDKLSQNWFEISHISPSGKPIALLEFGTYETNTPGEKANWIRQAILSVIQGSSYSGKIHAISYWNEAWPDENGNIIDLRVDSSPQTIQAYKSAVNIDEFISIPRFKENN